MKSPWRKARASNPSGNCVEVAVTPGGRVAVRDTTNRRGPVLAATPASWARFLHTIRA